MQWQKERKQESFLKLVSTTRNLHFVVRFSIWFFVYHGYTFISIFHSTIQLVSWQNNKMWKLGHCRMLNHTEINTLLDVLHQSCCRMRLVLESHLVTCLFCILFTFSHILTFLCRGNRKRRLFCTCLHKKVAHCTYPQNTWLLFLHIEMTAEFSKQGTAHHSVTDKGAITGNFRGICCPSSFEMGSSLSLRLMKQSLTHTSCCVVTHIV